MSYSDDNAYSSTEDQTNQVFDHNNNNFLGDDDWIMPQPLNEQEIANQQQVNAQEDARIVEARKVIERINETIPQVHTCATQHFEYFYERVQTYIRTYYQQGWDVYGLKKEAKTMFGDLIDFADLEPRGWWD
jgi:hypothetical protein